jgi:hypothetical protein
MKICGPPACQAVADEQPGDQEHAGHEETVVEQHDQVETEPAHFVAAAEMSVVDNGMMQHDQKRNKRARAVERGDAQGRRYSLFAGVRLSQHELS